jgi:hypothetical protein
MLGLLVVLILVALSVCAAATMPAVAAVVTAGIVVAIAPRPSMRADCAVAARSAGDTARSGRSEDKKCAGGGIAPVATLVASGL